MNKLSRTLIVPVMFLAGCGAAADMADQSAGSTTKEAVAFLEETESAAKSYGRDKLGHFLKLDAQALKKQGLKVPEGTSLKIHTAHSDYCIEVEDGSLPAGSRWKNATVASGFTGISSDDACRLSKK